MKKNLDDEKNDWLEEEELPVQRSIWLRIVAAITALFFIGMIIFNVWTAINYKTSWADLVIESLHLKKQVDPQLFDAVVKVNVIPRQQDSTVGVQQKSSTGFNIEHSGLIVTNHHVLEDAHSVTVLFPDGKKYIAKQWSSRPQYDLALIELGKADLPAVSLNYSSPPVPGDTLTVIGNPINLSNIVVQGKLEQYIQVKDKPGAILRIDIPIYPGNSGSPVFDVDGRVVGVVFGIQHIKEDGNELFYGLAIPIKEILELLNKSDH